MAIRQGAMEEMVIMLPRIPNSAFWQGRKVLLTGHTGFKGAWLAFWLQRMGAQVRGMALAPATTPSLYDALNLHQLMQNDMLDIRDAAAVRAVFEDWQPEVVLHLAAQALVRPAYRDPVGTYATNLMGSVHVLDAMRAVSSVRAAVMVTTDKVYKNFERSEPYPESAELGGHDPYSASKAASELVIASYRQAFLEAQGVRLAVARAGNVIGGGDWSEDRLLPDAIRAWQSGDALQIRRPQSVRPWQHVLEPLSAYLCLAEALYDNPAHARAWNFGPDGAATVREVISIAQGAYGRGETVFATQEQGPHEAGLLALDATLARRELNLFPRWDLHESVLRTIHWYKAFGQGQQAQTLCDNEIADFCRRHSGGNDEE